MDKNVVKAITKSLLRVNEAYLSTAVIELFKVSTSSPFVR